MATVMHHRARVARAVQRGDEEGATEARRDLLAAKLEQTIRAAVNAAPPLSAEQRAQLAGILVPPATDGDARRAA